MDEQLRNTVYFVEGYPEPVRFDDLDLELQEALMLAWSQC